MDVDFIDLTGDLPVSKRRRKGPSSSGDVEILDADPSRTNRPDAEGTAALDDEDIQITGTVGQVWNQDLPHTRDQCGKHAFQKQLSLLNASFCSKCYCYVCDTAASACAGWGDGKNPGDHCNAYPSGYYDHLKQCLRAGRQQPFAAAGPSGVMRIDRDMDDEDDHYDSMDEYGSYEDEDDYGMGYRYGWNAASLRGTPEVKGRPITPLPEPSTQELSEMVELFTLRLACKAVGENTIASLKSNLLSWGCYQPNNQAYGNVQCLDNLFVRSWSHVHNKSKATKLKLVKLPLPEGTEEPSSARVYPVVVSHYDGKAPATVYGVPGERSITLKEVAEKLAEVAPLGPREAYVIGHIGTGYRWRHLEILSPDTTLSDREYATRNCRKLLAYRVPVTCVNAFPAKEPTPAAAKLAVVHLFRQDTKPDSTTKWKHLGIPLLLPVHNTDHVKGGVYGDRALKQAIGQAMSCYATGSPSTPQSAALLPSDGVQLSRSCSNWEYVAETKRRFASPWMPTGSTRYNPTHLSKFLEYGRINLDLYWNNDTTLTGKYDLKPLKEPQQHASASQKVLEASYARYQATMAHKQLKDELKQLPSEVVKEISAAARVSQPKLVGGNHMVSTVVPSVKVQLELEEDPEDEAGKRGTAVLQVYTWRTAVGNSHKTIFGDLESWSCGRYQYDIGSFVLSKTMHYLMRGSTQYDEMMQQYNDCTTPELQAKAGTLKGLMEVVESKEMPEAAQPVGLKVQLRSYQLQSLRFMQDCEQVEGGFRRYLWVKVPDDMGSISWWYSPILQRAVINIPPQPWGGFLAEEMGLGKTVEILGLILSNPAPPVDGSTSSTSSDQSAAPAPHPPARSGSLASIAASGSELNAAPQPAAAAEAAVTLAANQIMPSSSTAVLPPELGGPAAPPQAPAGPAEGPAPAGPSGATAVSCASVKPEPDGASTSAAVEAARSAGATAGPSAGASTSAAPLDRQASMGSGGLLPTRATLVVCAVSLVGQWMDEALSKLEGSLRVHMYHGTNRIRNPRRLANEFDLVVTTYQTLGNDYNGSRKTGSSERFPPLGCIQWHRLVLDESHMVKNSKAVQSQAVAALASDRRWCCSGTPINIGIDDLLGQFNALHLQPFCSQTFFNAYIKQAYSGSAGFRHSCKQLLYILSRMMIRHTKEQVLGGQQVLNLPPKTEVLVPVSLSTEEKALYLEAHRQAKAEFERLRFLGPAAVSKRILQVMGLLLPMRRICSGGRLQAKDVAVGDVLGSNVRLASDTEAQAPDSECSICLDSMEAPARTPCGHWFCRECILGAIQSNHRCPLCRQSVTAKQLVQGTLPAQATATKGGKGSKDEDKLGKACDSKLKALVAELHAMRAADPAAKALIFSQYASTLSWLQTQLPKEGFDFRTITGSMTLKKRKEAIEAFQASPPTTVFLLSMRSGAVGINLTAASHVFLLEPCLNPALEEQAVGRSWRMGQQKPVTIKKFYVKGAVEERIMEVVSKRMADNGSTSGQQGSFLTSPQAEGGAKGKAAAVQDLAGSIRADKQNLKLAELDVLFQEPKLDN